MLLPAALAMPVMHYWVGKQSFAPMTVTKWFGEGATTEIAAWALVASACILAVFLLSYFLFSRKYGMSTEGWGYKTSAPNFFKSLLLAFMTFLTAYAFVFIADFFFVTDFRFWLIAMRTFNANKVHRLCSDRNLCFQRYANPQFVPVPGTGTCGNPDYQTVFQGNREHLPGELYHSDAVYHDAGHAGFYQLGIDSLMAQSAHRYIL